MPIKLYIKMSRLALKLKALGREEKDKTKLLNFLVESYNEKEVDKQLLEKGLNPKNYELKGEYY